ncbi:response regulator [Paenibacillus sp. JDR-2]|uniref:response regulator transcription factor n=1 Tax=Paenibacillus sp. (strain JDR-2) TaxID=324057 RepID=UPI0001668FE4|nr:response regulator [Paenibacillus sp. JDR-2]ACS99574.1 two component transcriptional regulator, AraC family [Paenibacillus sp. JDR-2]
MYRLLIVDDEERARTGIKMLIDWAAHRIEIVGEARDGAEALEIMEGKGVDILLTDIRMPVMDGLELIQQVSKVHPAVRCIIMSGHDEFAYAQKAMASGVAHYLLKPSRRQEILDLVIKLTEEIAEERRENEKLEGLRSGFRESFPFLKEYALSRLALTETPPYDRLLNNLMLSDISFPLPFFGALIVQIDNLHLVQQRFGSVDIELFKYALKNIAEETFAPLCRCAAFEHNDDVVLLMNAEEWLDAKLLLPYAEAVQHNAEGYLKFTVSVGIGSFDRDIRHFRPSFQEAEKALNAKFYEGSAKITDYLEAAEEEDFTHTSYPLESEKAVLQAIVKGEEALIRGSLQDFLASLQPESSSKENVSNSIYALYFALYRDCIERNVNVMEVFGSGLNEIPRMMARSGLEHIVATLTDTALKIADQLSARKNGNKLFESILAYVHEHFRLDISRESVAREVYVTPGYISYLFKQQMQTSFIEYLHRIRIEYASRLLKDPSLRISDIAHESGYQDEKYFFQVFKKHTGMTPTQYRNNL